MKAVVQDRFGPPDVLELREVDEPDVGDGDVLVRVRAASVNPADWYLMTGMRWVARPQMGLRRLRSGRLGVDLAGEVTAVGAALTALQGLRDKGRVRPGQRVLVNGASGGVGTFAVQLAKALGAEVTAVCSTRNGEAVRSLGADRVVDYTHEDFTAGDRRHDLLLDVAGSRPWSACRRVLAPRGRLVLVGAPKGSRLLGPLVHIATVGLASLPASQKVVFFISKSSGEDLAALAELLETGAVTPCVERTYPLAEAADALRYLGQGHARGKLVVTVTAQGR